MAQIKDETQYRAIMARVEKLLFETDENTPADDARLQELESLSVLVEEYEREHYPIETASHTPLKQMDLTPIEGLISKDVGAIGSPERDQFEMECDVFIIGEKPKEQRLSAGLSREHLADIIGIPNDFEFHVEKGHADLQLSTGD